MEANKDFFKDGFKRPALYQIKIGGAVHPKLSERLAGMQITTEQKKSGKQISILTGIVRDQGALSGILNTLYEQHLSILSVKKLKNS